MGDILDKLVGVACARGWGESAAEAEVDRLLAVIRRRFEAGDELERTHGWAKTQCCIRYRAAVEACEREATK